MLANVPRYLRRLTWWWRVLGLVIAGVSVAIPAAGAELDGSPGPSAVAVHAFVSQGYIKSTGNDYLVASKGAGSFDFSEAGINFTAQLTDKFRVGMQLFAYEQGKLGQYATSADWYYLDYHFRDTLGVRAGRLKMPIGLYGDIADIDAARIPVLLPSGIYPAVNRDLLLAQTGAEIYGYLRVGILGALDYRVFGGSLQIVLPSQAGAATQISDYAVPYVGGGRLLWETPLEGLRVGLTGLALRAKATIVFPGAGSPALTLNESEDLYYGIGSIEYAVHDLLLQAEFASSRAALGSDNQAVFPNRTVVSDAGYGLVAYRVRRWLQPGAYYSLAYYNRNLGAEQDDRNVQHDLAATVRFDINNFWIVKLEGHFMHGTELINGGDIMTPVLTNPVNWGVFLVKTTGYF
jgi:hypothetical protein